jgi:TonB family protein
MRSVLVCLAVVALTAVASAQEANLPENGLGPYHFGMTLAEVEATSQHATWRVEQANSGQVLSGGPSLRVGSATFTTALVFDEDALRFIILTGQTPSNCTNSVRTLIEGDLEPSFGAFSSAPGPNQRGRLIGAATTTLGSEIREMVDPSEAHIIYSSRRGGMFIEVKGDAASNGAQGCRISLGFNAQVPYTGPQLGSVSYRELDQARTLVGARWISRPGASAFDQYYPHAARNAGIQGNAMLDCIVNADGSLRCLVANESPAGGGFGDAAIHIAPGFRVLQSEDGASAVGKRIRVSITFRLAG